MTAKKDRALKKLEYIRNLFILKIILTLKYQIPFKGNRPGGRTRLCQCTHRWRALMNAAVDLRVPYTAPTRPGFLRCATVEHGYPTRVVNLCYAAHCHIWKLHTKKIIH